MQLKLITCHYRLFSSKVGLPLGISDSDITAEPPGTIPLTEEEEAELYPCRTFVIDAELVKLRHEMTTSLYEYLKIHDVADDELTDPKGGPLVCKVLEYHSKLVYWEHNLPDDLKICIHRDGKVSGLTRRIATIYLCYYQVRRVSSLLVLGDDEVINLFDFSRSPPSCSDPSSTLYSTSFWPS